MLQAMLLWRNLDRFPCLLFYDPYIIPNKFLSVCYSVILSVAKDVLSIGHAMYKMYRFNCLDFLEHLSYIIDLNKGIYDNLRVLHNKGYIQTEKQTDRQNGGPLKTR